MNGLNVFTVSGQAVLQYIPELARLRIEIFREFPYLYDGSLGYEEKYLRNYADSDNSVIVVATDCDQIIGASTALPLLEATNSCIKPFEKYNYNLEEIFYFGESVLKKTYRGQGIGVKFFEHREAHAQKISYYRYYAFCAVERAEDHPRRGDYITLDKFWQHRGFHKHPELFTQFSWKDIDEETESEKKMTFWLKSIQNE